MKKITSIALILVLALLLPCFAACNGEDTPAATTPAAPDGTTAAPADTTSGQVTNADGSCRHAKMGDWVITGNYTCQGLAISTRACAHCDFIQYEYTDDGTGNFGDHTLSGDAIASFPGSANTPGFEAKVCEFCQETVVTESAGTDTRKNLFLISPEDLAAAGKNTVADYVNAGLSNVKWQTESGWGRKGFTAIHGMAALLNGQRDASATDASATILYWNIKDVDTKYTPDAVESPDGKYCSLIGYPIANPITVSGFSIFVNPTPEIQFDLLGGKKNDDGTITWTVLGGVDDVSKYMTYNDYTKCYYADFDEITVDCIQLGIISAVQPNIYISELEIYGN